jgi:hypothetical protein
VGRTQTLTLSEEAIVSLHDGHNPDFNLPLYVDTVKQSLIDKGLHPTLGSDMQFYQSNDLRFPLC